MSKMCSFTIIFAIVAILFRCANGECENNDMPQLKKHILREYLFCKVDTNERPVVNPTDATNVTIQMILKSIDYDMHSNALQLNFWLTTSWMDQILTWKPEEHDNIKDLIVKGDAMWNPDLSVYNRVTQSGSASIIASDHCVLKSSGQVTCVSPNNQDILCEPNLKYFPFDVQNCTMIIGSWTHQGEEISLLTPKKPTSLADYKDIGEWRLKSVNVTHVADKYDCCPNQTFPYMNYVFIVERHSGVYVCIAIVPAITMFILTMAVFFMDIRQQERTIVICANLMVHLLMIQFLGWSLPVSGPNSPLILLYTRDSMIMTTFLLVLTIVQRKLIQCKMESPKWIATATGYAMNSRFVQLIFTFDGSLKQVAERLGDDDGRSIVENVQSGATTNTDWLILAQLLDRLSLMAYLIGYVCMFIAFTP